MSINEKNQKKNQTFCFNFKKPNLFEEPPKLRIKNEASNQRQLSNNFNSSRELKITLDIANEDACVYPELQNSKYFVFKGQKIEMNSLDNKGTEENQTNTVIINNSENKICAQHEKGITKNRIWVCLIVIFIFFILIVSTLILII